MRKWRIEDSEELYNITGWGTSYFSINDKGHVVVTPRKNGVAVENELFRKYFKAHKNMVISMANLLFKITLDDKDRKLLAKSLRKNKEFLESVQMTKKEFDSDDILMVEKALSHRYKFRAY